jgi:hypothetical protein
MSSEDVYWTRVHKDVGGRQNSWELLRELLKNVMKPDGPRLFVFHSCRQFIRRSRHDSQNCQLHQEMQIRANAISRNSVLVRCLAHTTTARLVRRPVAGVGWACPKS